MTMMEMQKKVARFVAENHLETSVETRLLDLVSEIGELSKVLLKGTSYGKEKLAVSDQWKEEFGDVLFSLICIANSTGIQMQDALETVLAKYNRRMQHKGDISSGE